jgi:hypothetical protein
MDIVGHGFADEEARHARDMDRREHAEHVVVEGFAHPREREAGQQRARRRLPDRNSDHGWSSADDERRDGQLSAGHLALEIAQPGEAP